MTNEQIEKFIGSEKVNQHSVKIHFKTRNPIVGIFISLQDYNELKSKNFWRIVTETNIDRWKKSQDANLARIFNGVEMTRLTAV